MQQQNETKFNANKTFLRYGDDIIWSLPLFFQYEPIWAAIYDGCKYTGKFEVE